MTTVTTNLKIFPILKFTQKYSMSLNLQIVLVNIENTSSKSDITSTSYFTMEKPVTHWLSALKKKHYTVILLPFVIIEFL